MCEETCIRFYSKSMGHTYLSNFHIAPMSIHDKMWPTVEHYFQAQKATTEAEREAIRTAPSPMDAKRMGRHVTLRADWDDAKMGIMRYALRCKFSQHPQLREQLIETHPHKLHEASPTDMVWGERGLDLLGKMLMEVRQEYLR